MILLGNELLYDPTTLPDLLSVCDLIGYIQTNFTCENLTENFKFADYDMMLTSVKVLQQHLTF